MFQAGTVLLKGSGSFMIAWSSRFPKWKYPLGYWRLLCARHRYFDRLGLRQGNSGLGIGKILGDQSQLTALKDKGAGKRCFIIGNGPSLNETDLSPLKNEITIATNGAYKAFDDWGFTPTYLLFEDIEQTEIRGQDIRHIDGPLKIAALYNAHGIARPWRNLLFMNARLADETYWTDPGIQFSQDFAQTVNLGSTIIYIALQLAFYLGCDPVYLTGVDHDYGDLSKNFPPGKITITEENKALVNQAHFTKQYYKTGDVIGVPDTDLQTKAFQIANDAFAGNGRKIFNATNGGKLDVFDRADYASLFSGKS